MNLPWSVRALVRLAENNGDTNRALQQVRSGMGVYAGAARRRVHLATVLLRPSTRQTPGRSCPYPSDGTPPDATMKRVGAPSAWSSPSDLDKKEFDGRDPPQGVAPHGHRGVVSPWSLRGIGEPFLGTYIAVNYTPSRQHPTALCGWSTTELAEPSPLIPYLNRD